MHGTLLSRKGFFGRGGGGGGGAKRKIGGGDCWPFGVSIIHVEQLVGREFRGVFLRPAVLTAGRHVTCWCIY